LQVTVMPDALAFKVFAHLQVTVMLDVTTVVVETHTNRSYNGVNVHNARLVVDYALLSV